MNTTRSEKKVKEFFAPDKKYKRICQKYERKINASPEKVFIQICPTREFDWINDWDCELIYTSTGYVEKDCIFTTVSSCPLGPGIWIVTEFVSNEKVQIVRIIENSIVLHMRINFTDNHDGTTTGNWELQFTALNEQGNQMIENMPGEDPQFAKAIDELEYFVINGELMEVQ